MISLLLTIVVLCLIAYIVVHILSAFLQVPGMIVNLVWVIVAIVILLLLLRFLGYDVSSPVLR